MDRKKALRISGGLYGGCILCLLTSVAAKNIPLLALAVACSLGGMLLHRKYWRCHHCNGYLGRKGRYCPRCGRELEEDLHG